MTKSELVEKLSNELRNLSKTEIEIIVDTVFNKVTEALKKGGRVELRGFGTFEVRRRPARQGRNPKTGVTVYVKNRSVPFFKVGKELRERVNNSLDQETVKKTDELSAQKLENVL
ncbi:MAG: integration host factor subunit beta [bacterium]|nr:integration host factor subunit beta [bacterium]MBU1917331.1 integration host factor subunit beta [bacterium]